MKSGFVSSEFAITAAALLAGVLNKKLGLDIDPQVLLGLLGAVATYIAQRGWVKGKAVEHGLPPFYASPEMSAKMSATAK